MKTNKVPNEIYIFEDELQREDHVVMYGVNQDKGIDGLRKRAANGFRTETLKQSVFTATKRI